MKEKMYYWLLVLTILLTVGCQVQPKATKLVITKPVVIECTGPVTHVFKQLPFWNVWWQLPNPPVQTHY